MLNDEIDKIQTLCREKGLQVIVKLANIHLTPEKPNYDGGSWHIEGLDQATRATDIKLSKGRPAERTYL